MASDTIAPSLQGLDTVAARTNDTSFDTMYGINAIDDNDGDVTRNIKVSGNFDISKTGDYQLTYTVKDAAGNEATGNRTIHVTDDNIATITFNPNGGIGSMSPQTVTTDGSYQISGLPSSPESITIWNRGTPRPMVPASGTTHMAIGSKIPMFPRMENHTVCAVGTCDLHCDVLSQSSK